MLRRARLPTHSCMQSWRCWERTGNHCTVKLGHSSACVITRSALSYRVSR